MNKKHAKEMARRKKLARRAEHRALDIYPKFVFVENEAPPEFVELVKQATREIDFQSDDFPSWEQDIYRRVRAEGHPVR